MPVHCAKSVLRGVDSFIVKGPVITRKMKHDAIIELLFAELQLDIHPCRRTDHSQVNAWSKTLAKKLANLGTSLALPLSFSFNSVHLAVIDPSTPERLAVNVDGLQRVFEASCLIFGPRLLWETKGRSQT